MADEISDGVGRGVGSFFGVGGSSVGGQFPASPSASATLNNRVAALARVRDSHVLANMATPKLSVDEALAAR